MWPSHVCRVIRMVELKVGLLTVKTDGRCQLVLGSIVLRLSARNRIRLSVVTATGGGLAERALQAQQRCHTARGYRWRG